MKKGIPKFQWLNIIFAPLGIVFGVLFVISFLVLLLIQLPGAIFQSIKGIPPTLDRNMSMAAGIIAAVSTVFLAIALYVAAFIAEPLVRIGSIAIVPIGVLWYFLIFRRQYPMY